MARATEDESRNVRRRAVCARTLSRKRAHRPSFPDGYRGMHVAASTLQPNRYPLGAPAERHKRAPFRRFRPFPLFPFFLSNNRSHLKQQSRTSFTALDRRTLKPVLQGSQTRPSSIPLTTRSWSFQTCTRSNPNLRRRHFFDACLFSLYRQDKSSPEAGPSNLAISAPTTLSTLGRRSSANSLPLPARQAIALAPRIICSHLNRCSSSHEAGTSRLADLSRAKPSLTLP